MESGSTTYSWDLGNGTTSVLDDPASSYDRGIFTATLIAKSNLGCEGTHKKTFELIGPDGEIIINKQGICLGDEVTVQLVDPIDVNEWQWDMGDGTVYENEQTVTHTYTFIPPDNENKIDLVLKSLETGCEVIKSVPSILNEVFAEFELVEGLDYCAGLASFKNLSVGGTDFEWDFGEGRSSEFEPTFIFESNGEKVVTLTISDQESGCVSTYTGTIDISGQDSDFFDFPNVFSPNRDGVNDLFRPLIPPGFEDVISVTSFEIYDRWGQRLFNNDSPAGWDGVFKGDEMPSDVYAYYLELEVRDCKVVNGKGNVTLLR